MQQSANISGGQPMDGVFAKAVMNVTRAHNTVEGVVVDRDLTAYTCTVRVGIAGSTSDFTNVPMQVLIGSQASVIQIPAINSDCHLKFLDGNLQRPQLDSVDTCEQFRITIGSRTLVVDANTFTFDGGANGGMVLVSALVSAYNSVVTDLNTIKAALNGLGAPVVITSTTKTASDFENNNIVQ